MVETRQEGQVVKSNSSAQTRAKRDASGVESEVPHPHIHGEMAYGQSLNSFTIRPEWGYAAVKQGGFYHAETAKYYTYTQGSGSSWTCTPSTVSRPFKPNNPSLQSTQEGSGIGKYWYRSK